MSNRGYHKGIIMFWYVSIDNMQFHSIPPNIMAMLMDFPFLPRLYLQVKMEGFLVHIRVAVRVIFKQTTFLCQGSKVNLKRAPSVEDYHTAATISTKTEWRETGAGLVDTQISTGGLNLNVIAALETMVHWVRVSKN